MDATPKDEAAMMFDIVKMLADVTDLKVVKETKTEDGGWKLDRERWRSS